MKAILVAYSDNHVIGNQGAIPWMGKMPADMRRVRELTANQAIIMGKATFTSIGHPLPRRQNIVLTHDQTFSAAGIDVAQSLDDGLALVENGRDSFIFGGAKVYAESLRRAVELDITTVFATEIHARFSGDAKFPELDPDTWQEVERTDFPADNENMFAYSFVKYERFSSLKRHATIVAEMMEGSMSEIATPYEDLLTKVLAEGNRKTDRTGTGTISLFGAQMRYDLSKGFPLLTTKKVFTRLVIEELLWMLAGDSNIERLVKNNVHIWDEWPFRHYLMENNLPIPEVNSDEWNQQIHEFTNKIASDHEFAIQWGELGPVYGFQWRHWPTADGGEVDQIARALDQIKNSPDSRRIIVSAWNAADIDEMAKAGLPPCHALFQFYVVDGKLSCQLYQRSCDMFLGVPFNIASYSFLTHMMAQQAGLEPGEFIWAGGDCHIYFNHVDQVKEQLSRDPRAYPTLKLEKAKDLYSYTADNFIIEGYDPWPAIKAPIAV